MSEYQEFEFEKTKIAAEKIKSNIGKIIVGKESVIDLIIVSLFCSGHILLEDVPGTGKTVLAKTLAKSIGCSFKRIQFTPDLLPSDITGINFYSQKLNEFVFKPGPIFTNIILADEINRATPRTQSSMLECMEERQVSIDGETHILDNLFFVIATQNPLETQGTFPLPEAQLDRFFMRLKLGYPNAEQGIQILDRFQKSLRDEKVESVLSATEIVKIQKEIVNIGVSDVIKKYIISLVEYSRIHDKISLGLSPRGSLALMKAAQAYAVIKGRNFTTPDDVKAIAIAVMSHRIILKGHAFSNSTKQAEEIIAEILRYVPVPIEDITFL
jgi:MoxR-like ATPase